MTRKKLSEDIKAAEVLMHQTKRAHRPGKDNIYPSVEDREIEMLGRAAEAIAEYNHLMRLWEAYSELDAPDYE